MTRPKPIRMNGGNKLPPLTKAQEQRVKGIRANYRTCRVTVARKGMTQGVCCVSIWGSNVVARVWLMPDGSNLDSSVQRKLFED